MRAALATVATLGAALAPAGGAGADVVHRLSGADGKPIAINGLWGIAFGNGGLAGPRTTLFFASGPHRRHDETESDVHGLLGSIEAAR